MSVFDLMVRIKNLLNFDGWSVKIGLENSLNIDDYPMIRIVPQKNAIDEGFDSWAEDIYFSVYIGVEFDPLNLERAYQKIYAKESDIYEILHNFQWEDGGLIRFIDTSKYENEHFLMLETSFKIQSFRLR
nr:hypothetical protein [Campylobacter sp.]